MATSMEHWNGDQMCVLDIETTGLKPGWHEIIQIALLPLDSNIKPRKDVMPFYIEMAPDFPERIDKEAMSVSQLKMADVVLRGHDQEKSKDLLVEWVKKLGLPCTKYGTPKRIIILGHNVSFDKGFVLQWLGADLYNEIFDARSRDTMTTGCYLNDCAGMHAETIPYFKVNLAWMAKCHNIIQDRAHDALQDCMVTAEIYRHQLTRGLLG